MTENENDLATRARAILGQLFENIPALTVNWDRAATHVHPDVGALADFTFEIQLDNRVHQIACVCKPHGFPQQLHQAIAQLLRYRYKTNGHHELLVAAPFITPEGASVCREDKVSYVDLAGNCRIAMGALYLERTGQPNPFQKNAMAAPALYGMRGERILRTLLQQPTRAWKVTPLATQTGVSAGTVSIIRKLLIERDWAKDGPNGIELTQPEKLLRDWAQVWGRRAFKRPFTYFSRVGVTETERKIADFAEAQNCKFALTGAAAAWRHAPMTRYQRTQAYWDGEPEEIAAALDLKKTESGANLQLLVARDRGVFDFAETIDGVPVVCPVQAFLDLHRDPARGEEAAERLWQTKLFHA